MFNVSCLSACLFSHVRLSAGVSLCLTSLSNDSTWLKKAKTKQRNPINASSFSPSPSPTTLLFSLYLTQCSLLLPHPSASPQGQYCTLVSPSSSSFSSSSSSFTHPCPCTRAASLSSPSRLPLNHRPADTEGDTRPSASLCLSISLLFLFLPRLPEPLPGSLGNCFGGASRLLRGLREEKKRKSLRAFCYSRTIERTFYNPSVVSANSSGSWTFPSSTGEVAP